MCVQDPDGVVTHHVDKVDVSESGSQLANHLPPVICQHDVQLALIVAQRDVPGQDVVSVGKVKHCGGKQWIRMGWCLFVDPSKLFY